MKLDKILDITPQIGQLKSGSDPSLRQLLEQYYLPHFPDSYENYVEDYIKVLKKESGENNLKLSSIVRIVFDTGENGVDSFVHEGVKLGDIGKIISIDNSEFPYNVIFESGCEFGFKESELQVIFNKD